MRGEDLPGGEVSQRSRAGLPPPPESGQLNGGSAGWAAGWSVHPAVGWFGGLRLCVVVRCVWLAGCAGG